MNLIGKIYKSPFAHGIIVKERDCHYKGCKRIECHHKQVNVLALWPILGRIKQSYNGYNLFDVTPGLCCQNYKIQDEMPEASEITEKENNI